MILNIVKNGTENTRIAEAIREVFPDSEVKVKEYYGMSVDIEISSNSSGLILFIAVFICLILSCFYCAGKPGIVSGICIRPGPRRYAPGAIHPSFSLHCP